MKTYNLVGQKFNSLEVLRFSRSLDNKQLWECRCDCGTLKEVNTYHLRAGRVKTCGCNQRCNGKRRTIAELEQFLLSKRSVSKSGCWEWTMRRNNYGYGMVSTRLFGSTNIQAHRLAAHLWLGMNVEDRRFVCHRCDNPSCFNPDHLFVGTARENTMDSVKKGRHRWSKSVA